jgi:uncharacterized protein
MSRDFPDFVDPWKAADGRRSYGGTMPLRRLRRLVPLLTGDSATWEDASFQASFAYDEQGAVTVDLRVEARLPLLCQRSLQPYLEHVERRSLLCVIEDLAEQDGLPDNYDPVLADHGRLALADLVEDELLLGVPQVPRNPEVAEVDASTDGAEASSREAAQERSHRPFAGLAGLLENTED